MPRTRHLPILLLVTMIMLMPSLLLPLSMEYGSIADIKIQSQDSIDWDYSSEDEEAFNKVYSWIIENATANDGSIVQTFTDDEGPSYYDYHFLEIPIAPLNTTFDLVNVPGDMLKANSTSNPWGLYFGVSDQNVIYVDTDNDFSDTGQFQLGDELLGYRWKYYVHNISENSVLISYGSWHINYRPLLSLVRMYECTGNGTYLILARPLVDYFLNHRNEWGLWDRWYATETEERYMGMVSTAPMYSLYKYYIATGDSEVFQVLVTAAENYIHTTERTTNHATWSTFGLILSQVILGQERYLWAKTSLDYLLGLFEPNGEITYYMDPTWPGYPIYLPRYWSYDVRVFMRIAEFRYQDQIYETVFPTAYNWAANHSIPLTHKISLLSGLQIAIDMGHTEWNQEFDRIVTEAESLDNGSYITTWNAVDIMELYTLKLMVNKSHQSLVYCSETGIGVKTDRTLEFSLETRISRGTNESSIVKVEMMHDGSRVFYELERIDSLTFNGSLEISDQSTSYRLLLDDGEREYVIGAEYSIHRILLEDLPFLNLITMISSISLFGLSLTLLLNEIISRRNENGMNE